MGHKNPNMCELQGLELRLANPAGRWMARLVHQAASRRSALIWRCIRLAGDRKQNSEQRPAETGTALASRDQG
jgi:hypothetical protein